jgi:hypothetical protein
MNHMRSWKKAAGRLIVTASVAASALSAIACGNVARQGRGPMFLVIDNLTAIRGGAGGTTAQNTLLSDVITNVTTPEPCTAVRPCPSVFNDMGSATLRLSPKDVASTGVGNQPSTNNQVTISRYRVIYRRSDGRNTPGVDVPFGFDGAATVTVQPTTPSTMSFELVRHVAKEESPLRQLISSPTIITSIAEVSFYGRDQVGNDISVTGSIQIDFGNFGDF